MPKALEAMQKPAARNVLLCRGFGGCVEHVWMYGPSLALLNTGKIAAYVLDICFQKLRTCVGSVEVVLHTVENRYLCFLWLTFQESLKDVHAGGCNVLGVLAWGQWRWP